MKRSAPSERTTMRRPILLLLHGVGVGDPEATWRHTLDHALTGLGYPDLSEVTVIAPQYPMGLRGVDDDFPLPSVTVRAPRGEEAKNHRRNFERRRTAMEVLLGRDERGSGLPASDQLAEIVAGFPLFIQAENYATDRKVRAWVLRRILERVPETGRMVIVGHSLGSVIAADLLRRLPPGLEVAGMVTIGSPLAQAQFDVDGLRKLLAEPPTNLDWWVNFWSAADPVPARRGASTVIPWVLDQRVEASFGASLMPSQAHSALWYLQRQSVALAIGRGLFGSQSKEIVLAEKGLDVVLEPVESIALLALRYAHLMMQKVDVEVRDRFAHALRQVQGDAVDQIVNHNRIDRRLTPNAIARLAVDLSDPESSVPVPEVPGHLSIADAVVPLVSIATGNVLRPFELDIPKDVRQEAMEQLTLELGLGTRVGTDVFDALDTARRALKDPTNWLKWSALSLGAIAVVAATGGLALMAAPGAAGAAAITSALAAFGPGGMIGGLLTAGALMSAGGGSIAIGLAAPGTTAEAARSMVSDQLTAGILRRLRGLGQDPHTWDSLVEAESEITRQLVRLEPVSDDSAPTVKELRRKREVVQRALDYLLDNDLGPEGAESVDDEGARPSRADPMG